LDFGLASGIPLSDPHSARASSLGRTLRRVGKLQQSDLERVRKARMQVNWS
jgi:hypothetical protein